MRVLKYAILGLLNRQKMTGYDISNELQDNDIGHFWHAKHSQIYPELKKLVNEKLIEYSIVISGTKLEKKEYYLTDLGKESLIEWIEKADYEYVPIKDEFMLKTYFLSFSSKENAKKHLELQLKLHKIRLDFIEAELKKTMKLIEDEGGLTYESEYLGKYLTITKGISRERAYTEWLKSSYELIEMI